jgi:polysaccharide biosynthesis protein PslH
LKILVVSPFFPLPLISGGHTRLYNLLKRAALRHSIDLICPVSREGERFIPDLASLCRKVTVLDTPGLSSGGLRKIKGGKFKSLASRSAALLNGIPPEVSGFYLPEMTAVLRSVLNENRYDVVQVEFARIAEHFPKVFFSSYPCLKILVDYDLTFLPHLRAFECERRVSQKILKYVNYAMHRRYAEKTWGLFDRLVVTSDTDRERVSQIRPGLEVRVVPNGVDLERFRPTLRKPGD